MLGQKINAVEISQHNLGEMYLSGGQQTDCFGYFDQSLEEAQKWFQAAADQGCAAAYYRLAEMHRRGQCVNADPKEILRYASLAVYQNNKRCAGECS